jgi:hypothetical protein
MNKSGRLSGFAPVLILVFSAARLTAQPQDRSSPGWDDYDMIQFIVAAHGNPASILGLDDNGSLVLAAAGGVTRDDLIMRTGASESQLELLLTWRLLERRGDALAPTFPVLDGSATDELRSWTRALAPELVAAIKADVVRLHRELERRNRAANAYSILFSYVLDGLTWDLWESAGVIPPRELSVEHPFWDGEIWAVTPERAGLVGTNRISDERVALDINWSYAALPSMKPFVTDMASVMGLFEALADGDPVARDVRPVFEDYGLFDADGRLTIPILEAHAGDPLFDIANRIASTLVSRAPAALDLPEMRRRFGFSTDARALIIGFHELMWDLLDVLEERGLVQRPAVLDGAGKGPADVAALIFGVR